MGRCHLLVQLEGEGRRMRLQMWMMLGRATAEHTPSLEVRARPLNTGQLLSTAQSELEPDW